MMSGIPIPLSINCPSSLSAVQKIKQNKNVLKSPRGWSRFIYFIQPLVRHYIPQAPFHDLSRFFIPFISPAYDLFNSSIVLKGEIEEIALTMKGKKSNLNYHVLVNYFGKERCGITDRIIENTLGNVQKTLNSWVEMIEISFMSDEMKDKYKTFLQRRIEILGLEME